MATHIPTNWKSVEEFDTAQKVKAALVRTNNTKLSIEHQIKENKAKTPRTKALDKDLSDMYADIGKCDARLAALDKRLGFFKGTAQMLEKNAKTSKSSSADNIYDAIEKNETNQKKSLGSDGKVRDFNVGAPLIEGSKSNRKRGNTVTGSSIISLLSQIVKKQDKQNKTTEVRQATSGEMLQKQAAALSMPGLKPKPTETPNKLAAVTAENKKVATWKGFMLESMLNGLTGNYGQHRANPWDKKDVVTKKDLKQELGVLRKDLTKPEQVQQPTGNKFRTKQIALPPPEQNKALIDSTTRKDNGMLALPAPVKSGTGESAKHEVALAEEEKAKENRHKALMAELSKIEKKEDEIEKEGHAHRSMLGGILKAGGFLLGLLRGLPGMILKHTVGLIRGAVSVMKGAFEVGWKILKGAFDLVAKPISWVAEKLGLKTAEKGALKVAEKSAVKATEKTAGKLVLKGGLKMGLEAIPVVGALAGGAFAVGDLMKGHYTAAGLDAAAGLAGATGLGDFGAEEALSAAATAADVYGDSQDEKKKNLPAPVTTPKVMPKDLGVVKSNAMTSMTNQNIQMKSQHAEQPKVVVVHQPVKVGGGGNNQSAPSSPPVMAPMGANIESSYLRDLRLVNNRSAAGAYRSKILYG